MNLIEEESCHHCILYHSLIQLNQKNTHPDTITEIRHEDIGGQNIIIDTIKQFIEVQH